MHKKCQDLFIQLDKPNMCNRNWWTHRDEDEVGFPDGWVDVCRKKQVSPPAWLNHFFESWLKWKEVGRWVSGREEEKGKVTASYRCTKCAVINSANSTVTQHFVVRAWRRGVAQQSGTNLCFIWPVRGSNIWEKHWLELLPRYIYFSSTDWSLSLDKAEAKSDRGLVSGHLMNLHLLLQVNV